MASEGVLDQSIHPDPFDGNSRIFSWGKDINLPQFNAELSTAVPGAHMVSYRAVTNRDDVELGALPVYADITEDTPVTIFLSPSTIDANQVLALLAAHRPDPYFGMSDQQRTLVQIRAKLSNGEILTPEEMTLAMQAMLGAI